MTKRAMAEIVLGLLLAPTWFSVAVLASACNFGDPLQQGTGEQCHQATSGAPSIAWAYTAAVAALLVIAVALHRCGRPRGGRLAVGLGLVLALLPTAPVVLLYVA